MKVRLSQTYENIAAICLIWMFVLKIVSEDIPKKMAGNVEDNQQEVTRELLLEVRDQLGAKWLDVGRYLCLSEAELYNVQQGRSKDIEEAQLQMLLKWQHKNGHQATCKVLADALKRAGRLDLAENLPIRYKSLRGGYNIVEKIMEVPGKDTDAPTSTNSKDCRGFGNFMVDLAGFLRLHIVLRLATYFDFSSELKRKLHDAKYPGQLMVEYLRERGIITPTDISQLIKALEYLNLDGVKLEVLSSFQSYFPGSHQTPGKLNPLRRYLKYAYVLLYEAIQPIPYIRDRLYCVNDVFVEGGIEISNATEGAETPGASALSPVKNKPLSSHRDIFDYNALSKRVIVEGEPGYGKSTLTIQAAYDWCKEHFPLKGVELFILLPLRLMKGKTSIYNAIKRFILPRNCTLTVSEITDIMASCTTVVIVLDGYDEYPDINSDLNSDVMEIIKGKMFTDFKLILCTRTGCLPSNLDPRTVRIRLTGFDADARDRYIRMAVVGDSSERTNEMRLNLQKNPIMRDLCQVPLFFVMFAHMAHERPDIYKCNTVTEFFKSMIYCFYCHMWKKDEEKRIFSHCIVANTSRLHKVAFDGLSGDEQTIVWDKEQFCQSTGTKCFDELIKIGVLVQETSLEINGSPETSVNQYVKEKHTVRFYHKLFAEWYAAHYLAERASSRLACGLNKTFVKVNPLDLQFVFRFACGLKSSATRRIVNYLRKIEGCEPFANLCILEQTGGTENILDAVQEMCSKRIQFNLEANQLLQRSRMQLLNIASKNQIPISSVRLINCFQSVDLKEESLCLSSGLQLPRLDTLQELQIWTNSDLRDSARDVLDYSARCVALKSLTFNVYALLPQLFDDRHVLASLHRKNCKVEWEFSFMESVHLNLQTGKWETKGGQETTDDEYREQVERYQRNS